MLSLRLLSDFNTFITVEVRTICKNVCTIYNLNFTKLLNLWKLRCFRIDVFITEKKIHMSDSECRYASIVLLSISYNKWQIDMQADKYHTKQSVFCWWNVSEYSIRAAARWSWFDVNRFTFDEQVRETIFSFSFPVTLALVWPFDLIITPPCNSVRDNFREKYNLSITFQYRVNEMYVTDRQTNKYHKKNISAGEI